MNLELPNHLGGTVTNQPQSRYIPAGVPRALGKWRAGSQPLHEAV